MESQLTEWHILNNSSCIEQSFLLSRQCCLCGTANDCSPLQPQLSLQKAHRPHVLCSFAGVDIALFSAGGSISQKFAPLASDSGCTVSISLRTAVHVDKAS